MQVVPLPQDPLAERRAARAEKVLVTNEVFLSVLKIQKALENID